LVAEWLMEQSGERAEEVTGLIAEHLELAGQTERARDYLRRAGEEAGARFANAEAVAYLSRALTLTPAEDLAGRYALTLAREQVYDLQGTREAQAQDLAALQELAETLNDDRKRAEVALRRANYVGVTGDFPAAIAAVQVAIRLAQGAGDVPSEAAGHLEWGRVLWLQGDYRKSRTQFEGALELAQAAELRRIEAESLRGLGNAFLYEDLDKAKAYYEGSLSICRQIGDRRGEGAALNNLGWLSIFQGDYYAARFYVEQALHVKRQVGDRRGESINLNNLGWIAHEQGNYAEARAYYEQALSICREVGRRQGEGELLAFLGLLFHHLGDDEAAREYSRQALQITQDIGSRELQSRALTFLGHALAGLGDLPAAADTYQSVLALRRESGEHNLAMEPLAGLARVSLAQGDLSLAQAQVEEILEHLETGTLDGTIEPFRVYLTCYQVLRANQDPRAGGILDTTHHLLQERAARISDEKMRRSFLENVAAHGEIVSEFAKRIVV
jgi:tetratricopeptide (TPR) repeat protein